jgi:hypothetical protein
MVKVANLRLRVTGEFLKKQPLVLSLFSTNHRIVMTDTAELAEIPTLRWSDHRCHRTFGQSPRTFDAIPSVPAQRVPPSRILPNLHP